MKNGWRVAILVGALAGMPAVLAAGTGYLTGTPAEVDASLFLPPPPAAGSAQFAADQDVYQRMRALKDSPRWAIATADDRLSPDDLYKDFSCALGFVVTTKTAPKLTALESRAMADASHAIGTGKSYFKRLRPLVGNDLPICVAREKYADSFSYPSGHSTASWTFASILMSLQPERATAIAARARAYGESRAVCGVHWASDVEAGRLAASTVFAALQANADYRRDWAAARQELTALAQTAPKPTAEFCKTQADALARPW